MLLLTIAQISLVNGINWNIKQLSVTSEVVSSSTTLNFQLSSTQTITAGDCIKFTIQSPYVTPDESYTAFTTNPVCSFSTSQTATCTKLSTLSFQLVFTSSSTAGSIIGSATNFINPYSQRNLNSIDISYYTACSTSTKTVTGVSVLQNFMVGTIPAASVTIDSSPKIVGEQHAVLAVSFKPGTMLKISGIIEILLPEWYTVNGSPSTDTMFDSTSVVSSSTITINSYSMNTDPSVRTMSIYYTLLTAVDNTNSAVTVDITNFKNPISTALVTGFQINSKDSKGYLIDSSVSTLPMASAMTTVALMDSPSFTFRSTIAASPSTTFSVAQQTILTLNLQMPVPASDNCWVKVTFPSDIVIDTTLNTFYGTGFLQDPSHSSTISAGSVTITNLGNYIVINGCQDPTQIGSNPAGTVSFQYINMPAQVKSSGIFTVNIYANAALTVGICQASSFYIDQSQLKPGTIIPIMFQPLTSWIVQSPTTYAISFTPQHKLYYNSRIIITAPSLVTLGTTCSITSMTGLGLAPTCTVGGSTFIIDTPFNNNGVATVADYPGNVQITVNIFQGNNAVSARDAGSWGVSTFNCILSSGVCGYYTVDSGTATTSFTSTLGNLVASPGVTSNNYVTYAGSATYTFSFNVLHYVPAGGIIQITFPSEISISSTSLAASTALYINSGTQLIASATSNSISLTMQSTHTVLNNPLKVSFSGIRNPRSYQTSSTFTIKTQDSSGYTIDQGTGFSVTMNTMGTFNSVSATIANYTNGAITTYTLSLATLIPLYNNDIFYITFPNEVIVPSNNQISCAISKNLYSVSCSSSGQNLQVQFQSVSTSTGNFAFTVSKITNPPSTLPSSTFTSMVIRDSNGYNVAQYIGSVTVDTTTPANILTYSLAQSSLVSQATASYTITFTPTNKIAKTGSILLIWPAQVNISATSGCAITTTSVYQSNCAINVQTRTILITGAFSSASSYFTNTITIEIGSVTNPIDNRAKNGFQIYTYADALQIYKIDVLADYLLPPKLQCNYPCNTCSSSNKNYCLSCWTTGTFPFLQYVNSTAQTCMQKCSSGYTTNGNSNKQCQNCDASCATCVDASSTGDKFKCITCSSSYLYKYPPAQQCMASCGLGYYLQSPYVCDKCQYPCQACFGGATACTQCFLGGSLPYLFSNNCLQTCPSGYTSVGLQCQQCQSPCQTCQNSTSQCLTCDVQSGTKYNFGYQCYSTCPTGTTSNDQTLKCEGCLTGCKLCDSKNQTYCLECSTPLLTFQGSCVKSCPSGYKVSLGGTSCQDSALVDISLVYFPHLIAAAITAGICIGGHFKDKRSLIISNILVFWGPIEFSAIVVQMIFSVTYGTYKYAGLALAAFIFYVLANIAFSIYFLLKIKNSDDNFKYWRQYHKHTFGCISVIGAILSFKSNRLLYSFFYGHDSFKAHFSDPGRVQKLIIFFTIFCLIFTSAPILVVDVVGLILLSWGTQLYISMIETCLLTIIILVLTFVEFCRLRKLLEDSSPSYKQVNSDSQMITPGDEMQEKKSRKNAMKAIMAQVKGNRDLFLNNKLDELLQEFGGRKCKSMIALDSLKEEDERKIKSFPLSPKSKKEYDLPFSFDKEGALNKQKLIDNVYADSRPANPKGKSGKSFSDANTQLNQNDLKDAINRKDLDLINLENDDGMNSRRDKKTRRRGRKNKYYTQIDEEDDEEADALEDDDQDEDLDIIKEEDEETIKKNKEQKKLLQKQQEDEAASKKLAEEQALKQQEAEKVQEQLLQQQKIEQQQQLQLKEENDRKEKELLQQQEKLENEIKEKELQEKQIKEQALLQQQLEQKQQQEKEQQKQLELEKELEEERIKNEHNEQNQKYREDQDASRLEEEIISNKEENGLQSHKNLDLKAGEENLPEQQSQNIMSKKLQDQNKLGSIPKIERPISAKEALDTINQSNTNGIPNNDVVMMEESLQDFQGSKKVNEDASTAPPDANKRNFNENDILGDFDRDEKGNPIVLQDENGNYVDKQGRPVNERGYLLDKNGNGDIVHNADQRQKMFDNKDMDERGEIPAPFCVEKYNFNPHNIRGDFDFDKSGKPIIIKNKRGELVDKKGRRVNKKGFLTDKAGNIIDKNGNKKFDKKQLTSDGDLPKLFNYNGRRYDMNDIIGQFDKDPNNNIVFNKNKAGEPVDKLGRKVNDKGYLIDQQGNVIDKDGRKIFDQKHIKNGEVPKIFPFTKFNVKNVLGTFEMDPLGNPILDKNSEGQLIDRDGRRVNQRGYLIDANGNVIDKNGKPMFDKDILDVEGEIPKVFRTGLLKSDTASSLSRLMSEIEKNQPSEFDDDRMIQNETRRLEAQNQKQNSNRSPKKGTGNQTQRRDSGGNTSVDSMMEDTPSNYNIANQRFEPLKKIKKIKEEEESNDDGDVGDMAKKRRKKKKKLVAEVFVEPTNKDLQMAKAYGGQPKAIVKKKIVVNQPNSRMITTPASIQVRDQAKDKLQKLTNSISGYQNDPNGNSRNRGSNNFRPPGTLTQTNFMDQSNEASILAVPEHHLREEKLKQRKMNELQKRKIQKQKAARKQGANGDPDFEKMFGKDIDEFLEDSDWDIESFEKMSQYSRGSAKSAFGQGRLRGLESIYLQRLETSMKKGQKQKVAQPKAKFRIMHDRFIDDPELMLDGNGERGSGLSASNKNLAARGYMESANTTHIGKERSESNIFNGNKKYYDEAGKSTVNFEKSYVP